MLHTMASTERLAAPDTGRTDERVSLREGEGHSAPQVDGRAPCRPWPGSRALLRGGPYRVCSIGKPVRRASGPLHPHVYQPAALAIGAGKRELRHDRSLPPVGSRLRRARPLGDRPPPTLAWLRETAHRATREPQPELCR